MDPILVPQAIHSVFGMTLYTACAVLLTPMNSGFVSVISLETAEKKAKHFIPDEKKNTKITSHDQYQLNKMSGVLPM